SETIRRVHEIAVEALVRERKIWGPYMKDPSSVLGRSVDVLEIFVELLKALRQIADEHADQFGSEGMTRFFAMLKAELDDQYFEEVSTHLRELKFRGGTTISADLGKGNKGVHYVLRTPRNVKRSWKERFGRAPRTSYSFEISPRDEAGVRALGELRGRGINPVANALTQSTDHIKSFFTMLATELAFYVGCLNLQGRLAELGVPSCIPVSLSWSSRALSFTGLYDICLAGSAPARRVVLLLCTGELIPRMSRPLWNLSDGPTAVQATA
ncbi:MAG: hypothetical protein ACRDV4_05410, partial [Acidimicrobiales bacterium]